MTGAGEMTHDIAAKKACRASECDDHDNIPRVTDKMPPCNRNHEVPLMVHCIPGSNPIARHNTGANYALRSSSSCTPFGRTGNRTRETDRRLDTESAEAHRNGWNVERLGW